MRAKLGSKGEASLIAPTRILVACLDAAYIESADKVGRLTPRPPKRTGRENNHCSNEDTSHPKTAGRKDDKRVFSRSTNNV